MINQQNLLALQDNRSVLLIHNHPSDDTFSKNEPLFYKKTLKNYKPETKTTVDELLDILPANTVIMAYNEIDGTEYEKDRTAVIEADDLIYLNNVYIGYDYLYLVGGF